MKLTQYDKQAANVTTKRESRGRPRDPNSVTALAEKYGVNRSTLNSRIAQGMSPLEAAKMPVTPAKECGKRGAANNKTWREQTVANRNGGHSRIQHYPGRVVSYNTAYQRLKRDPSMSLHDACTTPSEDRRKSSLPNYDPNFTIREQYPEAYVNDLLSPHISDRETMKKWVRSGGTITHHRSILLEEDRRRATNATRSSTSKSDSRR